MEGLPAFKSLAAGQGSAVMLDSFTNIGKYVQLLGFANEATSLTFWLMAAHTGQVAKIDSKVNTPTHRWKWWMGHHISIDKAPIWSVLYHWLNSSSQQVSRSWRYISSAFRLDDDKLWTSYLASKGHIYRTRCHIVNDSSIEHLKVCLYLPAKNPSACHIFSLRGAA